MPRITYVEHDGSRHDVDVDSGTSIMRGALANKIKGIVGECGGEMACGTCHCYVDEAWFARVGPAGATEQQLLEYVASERKNTSRLGCQISVSEELNGLTVYLPASQLR